MAIRKTYERESKVDSKANRQTIENLKVNHRWPEGLDQVRKAVQECFAWARSFGNCALVTVDTYGTFMEFLVAGLYAFAPQGRIGGITSLTKGAGLRLLAGDVAAVTEFKTSSHYAFQPVILPPCMTPFLELYINQVVPRFKLTWGDDEPLFVSFPDGGRCERLGRYYTRFAEKRLGIHFTTTDARALNDTSAANACR